MLAVPATVSSPDSPAEVPSRFERWAVRWAAVLIVAAGLAAYRHTFRAPYELDDHLAIADNPSIRDLRQLGRVLSPDSLNMVGRPVLNLSYALNYAAGGLDPAGYHAADLAIHLLAGLALFGLARRTLRSAALRERFGRDAEPLAALIAGLWVLHPLQTEAVTYLTERAESLMGLFYLLTLYAFSRRWLALSWLACALGMATKEVMVTAPLAVLLYDRVFAAGSFRAAWAARKGYYLALAASWLLLGWLLLRPGWTGRTIGFRAGVSGFDYALTEAWGLARYVRLALWPHPLVFDYGGPEIVLTRVGPAAPYLAAVAAGLAAAALAWRRSKPAGFLAATFFLLLAPTSSVVPLVLEPVGEHRMYLPLACLLALAVAGGYAWLGRKALPAFAAAALALGAATFARNADYLDPVRLWSGSVAAFPRSARAQVDLGNALADRGGAAEAIGHYRQALRLRPDYAEAHYNLAVALERTGAPRAEAIAEYRAALRLKPDFAAAEFGLADALAAAPGGLPEAVAHYEAALRREPGSAAAHYNLGNALRRTPGREDEALAQFAEAVRLDPASAPAHNNLANELARRPGRAAEAIAHYEAALRLDPNLAEAHVNLANRLARSPGREREAMAHYEAALRLDPGLGEARDNLAVLYARAGRLEEARGVLQLELQRAPGDARAAALLARLSAAPPPAPPR
jgi:tetratricopeptide (TPR) repeat protein